MALLHEVASTQGLYARLLLTSHWPELSSWLHLAAGQARQWCPSWEASCPTNTQEDLLQKKLGENSQIVSFFFIAEDHVASVGIKRE